MQFLNWMVLGILISNWIAALLTFLGTFSILLVLRNRLLVRLFHSRRFEQVNNLALDLLDHTQYYFLFGVSFYIASLTIQLGDKVDGALHIGIVVIVLLQAAVWGNRLILAMVTRLVTNRMAVDQASVTTINLLGWFARVTLWVVILLIVLDNIPDFRVSTLLTSLGIGGVAVAIALQRILSDLFASLSIALDRPFVIGDTIVVGSQEGTVEHIGLKSTRLRSLTGEQIVISNSDLLASRIQNFRRMQDRRIAFNLKVTCQTQPDQLIRIPQLIREIIQGIPSVRFDRAHFRSIGDAFFDFEIVYTLLDPDYNLFMDIQQEINLSILKVFETEGIRLAFQ
jgi:small-conductance mechanosensitive channel